MIRTYGLHWHVDRVTWGWQNKAGNLLGSATRSARSKPVDFRDQRCICVLLADYDVVYIGQAGASSKRRFSRLKAHRSDHLAERWNRFSWFGTQWVTKSRVLSADTKALNEGVPKALNILEAVSIAVAEPRLNLQRGKWGDAEQYYQWWRLENDETEND